MKIFTEEFQSSLKKHLNTSAILLIIVLIVLSLDLYYRYQALNQPVHKPITTTKTLGTYISSTELNTQINNYTKNGWKLIDSKIEKYNIIW